MFKDLATIIELTDDETKRIIPPRLIYNETYLLRLIMFWFYNQDNFIINSDLDRVIRKSLVCANNARVYSNATLETPFRIRVKGEKDLLAESSTVVSGVVGQFKVLYGKKKEKLVLLNSTSQFIVLEANISKPLKKGAKNLKKYHQIARDIGCMVQTLSHLDNPYLDNLGLFVLAPESILKLDTFKNFTYKPSIEEIMNERVKAYGDDDEKSIFLELFKKLFQRIDIDCISFEDIIRFIKKNDNDYGMQMEEFYDKCLLYNGLQ